MSLYQFKCLKCGKKFKTIRYLHHHEKSVHHRQEETKRHIEHKEKEIYDLKKKLPGKKTNWLFIIILIILVALFVYFMYLK